MTSTSTTARFEQELTVSRRERLWRGALGTAPIFVVLIGLLVWIAILNPNFTDPSVFLAFLKRAAPLVILAAGQLFVIVSGEFDLSVGSLITAVVVAAAGLTEGDPDRTWWVVAALFGLGILVGLVNGVVTTRLHVPSFITTLGMLLILQGAVLYWSGGAPRGSLPDNFRVFGRRGIEDLPVIEQLPYSVIILVIVGVVAVLLLHRTTFGKQLFAAGGNPRAAALSGVDVPLVRTLAFVLSGISAVIAGILVGGFAGISQDAGAGYEFQAISAVVLGGAALGGGRGSMVAAMAGALALEALFTLLNLLGLPKPLRDAVQGLIIIGAVAYAAYRLRRAR
jgi:ribose transport system permease protein